ncbi:MAG: class I SAM-dependent methyltransferase [Clostridia bacterium]
MPIRLDERLTTIANLAIGDTVADIGCDHGKLGYYLLSTDRAKKIVATDISAKSLAKAEMLASENGVSAQLETRLGDGLKPLASNEADVVVVAGLGGDVISQILYEAEASSKQFQSFVLSPNTHPEKVRECLLKIGHTIVYDDLVFAGSKTYTVLKSKIGCDTLDAMQIKFGKFFKTCVNFRAYAAAEIKKAEYIISKNVGSKKLNEYIAELTAALNGDNSDSATK